MKINQQLKFNKNQILFELYTKYFDGLKLNKTLNTTVFAYIVYIKI